MLYKEKELFPQVF